MFTDEEKRELVKIIREATKERITKEEIMQIKDTGERQRLIAENMDLFTGESD